MKTENPTTLPATEVNPRPRRRNHTNKYKLTILERVDRCESNGERVGEVLRKEGLYSSQLATWRRQRREGTLGALGRKRGPKPSRSSEQLENEKLVTVHPPVFADVRINTPRGIDLATAA